VSGKSSLKADDYVHLHNHTEYSLLDGLTKVNPLMELVVEEKMTAVAITDHGTLSGAIDFYKSAKQHDVKPLIGIETYVAARKHTDKDPAKDKNRFHLILLAMNNVGYQNLMKLSSTANLDGFYYYPRVDHDLLEKYNEGLICLSGCMSGEIGNALKQGQTEQAVELAKWYKSVFGDRYYLEVQDHGHPKNPFYNKEQNDINDQVLKISKDLEIPAVVTCDAHYLRHEDQEAHEILLCVGTASYLSQTNRMSLKDFPLHVIPPNEIIGRWGEECPEAITNTKKIADRCDVNIEFDKILLPKFTVSRGKTESSQLHELVFQGLVWRYAGLTLDEARKLSIEKIRKLLSKEVIDRTDYELGVIDSMGFNSYFLIISDFLSWGRQQGIVFGPGRGSAAGSIISYALDITGLDPLLYDLQFERFLNPDRISMPDIDIDIQDTRREEVIKYCIDKYGTEKVANIVTFGRMYARNAVRDVARVLEVPYAEADALAKMLPLPTQGRHIPLAKSVKDDSDLKAEYESNPVSKRVLDLAIKLEGTVRSHGVHAAGVVIAPDDIVNFAPLEMAQKGVVATQYPLGPIEELGLLKMDFLGLSNLTTIKNALRIVKRVYDEDIKANEFPLDDPKTFELFQKGDTTGVFQFESAGMKRYLKELKPTSFEDIVAMVALYRPGPMQWIDDFIARKHGHKKIEFLHPSMENSLKKTYGVIVYQEQVMQISKDMCGFTGAQADKLRKAIAKKKPEELAKMKSDFIEGAIKIVDADKSLMEKFWTQLEDFAAYCFPKSHAACYAYIAYQTAYLKAHYPEVFMAAVMTSDYDNTDRLSIEISECQRIGVDVLPPDINESFYEFAVVPTTKQIRFGLIAIKNVGTSAVDDILKARENGSFESLEDFFIRVNSRVVNRKTLESLIKSGAFDRFGERNFLMQNLDTLLAFSSRVDKDKNSGQTDLFSGLDGLSTLPKVELNLIKGGVEATQQEKLSWERELLGLYLSEHPLDAYKAILADKTVPINSIQAEHHNKTATVGGAISVIRSITTKNGQKMAFVKIEDQFGELELIFFPGVFQTYGEKLQRDKVYLATGKLTTKDRSGNTSTEPKLLVDTLLEIDSAEVASYKPKKIKKISNKTVAALVSNPLNEESIQAKRLFIRLADSQDQALLRSLKQTIDENNGHTDVLLVLGPADDKQIIKLPMKVDSSEVNMAKLMNLVGTDNIKLH
jgi:DNA polymerase-3 subunit alpha